MDKGVRVTLPKAWAFGENTISKNERSLGEKPNFGSKLGCIGLECYFDLSVSALKSGICKKSSKMAKIISKNMGSLGDKSTENRGGLWSFTSTSPP